MSRVKLREKNEIDILIVGTIMIFVTVLKSDISIIH